MVPLSSVILPPHGAKVGRKADWVLECISGPGIGDDRSHNSAAIGAKRGFFYPLVLCFPSQCLSPSLLCSSSSAQALV